MLTLDGVYIGIQGSAPSAIQDLRRPERMAMDQDEPSRVGGDQEIKVLNEMNGLEQEHDQYMQDLKSTA